MPSGANVGSVFAGFGKGFSNALLMNRERADRKAKDEFDQQRSMFTALLPQFLEASQDLDEASQSAAGDAFMAQFPRLTEHMTPGGAKGKGKSAESPYGSLRKWLSPFMRGGLFGGMQTPVGNDLPEQGGITGNINRPLGRDPISGATGRGVALGAGGGTTVQPTTTTLSNDEANRILGQSRGLEPVGLPTDAPAPTGTGLYDLPGQIRPSQNASQGGANPSAAMMGVGGQPTQTPGGQPTLPPDHPYAPKTILGIPIISRADRAAHLLDAEIAKTEAAVGARRAIAAKLGIPPEQVVDFALYGTRPPAHTVNQEGFTLNPGDVRYDASGHQIANNPATNKPTTTKQPDIGTIGDYIVRRQGELGRALTSDEVAKAREDWEKLGKAGKIADDNSALAAMAAENPSVLQGLTPTVVSGVMETLAKNPQLRKQYETARMEPIRAQAAEISDSFKNLLQIDPKTGKVIGLSGGAKMLYGKSKLLGAQYIPGSETATAAAALDQLTGQQALDLIATMKAQSRTGATGFGQLNRQELALLESSASILKGNIDEATAFAKLKTLYEKYQKIQAKSATELMADRPTATGGGGSPAPAAQGTGYKMDTKGNILDAAGHIVVPAQ